MRPRQLKRRLWSLAALAVLLATGVGWSARAEAAPNICGALMVSPTVGTVEQLGAALMVEGWTPHESGQIIAMTVNAVCPVYWPVLERFIAAYDGRRVVA